MWAKIPQKKCGSSNSQQNSLKYSTCVQSQKQQKEPCSFKPFNITEIQVYTPTTNAEEVYVDLSMTIYKTFQN